MRVAHLSDLHLGFRAFPRTELGWNLRERDLAFAFQQALLEVARLDPAVVILSGDIFHSPDPPSTAFLTLTRGISTLRAHLPTVPILAVAGGSDTPAAPADPGPVAVLDALPGMEAASGAPRAVHLRDRGVHALLVPHRAALRSPFPEIRPNPEARWNILVIRGSPVTGDPEGEGGLRVDPSGWDYVAVGGPHRMTTFAHRVCAAGSLERTGWDPWREATEEKGFLMVDLETGEAEFHPLPGRPVVDLAPVRSAPGEVEAGSRRLRDLLDGIPGGVEGKILRVRLRGDLLSASEGVAPGLLGAIRKRTAHAEIRLSSEGDRTSTAAPEPREGVKVSLSLPGTGRPPILLPRGVTLLAAETEELRLRAASALRFGKEGVRSEGGATLLLEGVQEDGSTLPANPIVLGWPDAESTLEGVTAWPAQPEVGDPTPTESAPLPEESEGQDPSSGLEAELREARADAVEVAGDLEARAMEWARERQDAESHLMAYRDRARELRAKIRALETQGGEAPCPTCGRAIGEHLPTLAETLREEWEGVVQDGKWWKRRREQLDEKPEDLREMEGRALRMRARVQTLTRELDLVRESVVQGGGEVRPEEGGRGESTPGERAILRRSTTLLQQLSEGRLTGVRRGGSGGVEVEENLLTWRPPVGSESGLLSWAFQVAAAERALEEGREPPVLVLPQFAGAGTPDMGVRAIEILTGTALTRIPILLVGPPSLVGGAAEGLVGVVEYSEDPEGRPGLRWLPGGAPILRFGAAVAVSRG